MVALCSHWPELARMYGEDATQDAYLAVLEAGTEPDHPRAYMHTAARHARGNARQRDAVRGKTERRYMREEIPHARHNGIATAQDPSPPILVPFRTYTYRVGADGKALHGEDYLAHVRRQQREAARRRRAARVLEGSTA